jgi:hypothetical protein
VEWNRRRWNGIGWEMIEWDGFLARFGVSAVRTDEILSLILSAVTS